MAAIRRQLGGFHSSKSDSTATSKPGSTSSPVSRSVPPMSRTSARGQHRLAPGFAGGSPSVAPVDPGPEVGPRTSHPERGCNRRPHLRKGRGGALLAGHRTFRSAPLTVDWVAPDVAVRVGPISAATRAEATLWPETQAVNERTATKRVRQRAPGVGP
jgi:hypothetical protein